MTGHFKVQVQVDEDRVGCMTWPARQVDYDALENAIRVATDSAISDDGAYRIGVQIPSTDLYAKLALQRCGFRIEGRLRKALVTPEGEFSDVLLYGRLASDAVPDPQEMTAVLDSANLDSLLPKKRVIAHALLRDDQSRVLLLETSYKKDWELPGGVVEPDESPRLAAQREIYEEIGLHVSLNQPTLIDWMPPYLGWSDALEIIFDGGTLSPSQRETLKPDFREILATHWVPAAEVPQHVTQLSAKRILRLLAGESGYTEAGNQPS